MVKKLKRIGTQWTLNPTMDNSYEAIHEPYMILYILYRYVRLMLLAETYSKLLERSLAGGASSKLYYL